MRHVIIATGLYPPEIGGPATFAVLFEKGLEEQGIPYTTIPFSTVRHLPKIIRHLAYFFKVFRAARRESIVLALDPVSVGLPALFAARLCRIPFYLRAGGDYAWEQAVQRWGFKGLPEKFPGDFKLPLAGKFLVWTEAFVAGRAKRILTQSGHLASIVERWGVSREKIAVIPNAVRIPTLESITELRKELGWKDSEFVIVSAGRFVPWKGFTALIDAVASLRSSFPDTRLVIVGNGPDENSLLEKAKKLRIHAEFPGALPFESLAKRIKAANVFVLNTGYEGFSHQVLEALMLGVSVVTTSIPGNTDLAISDKNPLTVPFNDVAALRAAIERSLLNPEPANERARIAAELATRYTPERTFAETCKAIGLDF